MTEMLIISYTHIMIKTEATPSQPTFGQLIPSNIPQLTRDAHNLAYPTTRSFLYLDELW